MALVIFALSLALLSPRFAHEIPLLEKPILLFVAIEIAVGVIYLFAVLWLRNVLQIKSLIIWAILIGAILRIVMLTSTPILENDFYRYLWDGAVVTKGINPYRYAPSDIAAYEAEKSSDLTTLRQLALESGTVIERINHPHVRSIYPVIAQASFAIAHWLGPWSIITWRIILLFFDIATLIIIVMILKMLQLPLLWLIVYWWNPLMVKEVFNSGHLDVIALPFVLLAFLSVMRRQYFLAVLALVLATATKMWPVVLLPLIIRPLFKEPKRLILAVLLFVLLAGFLFAPVFAAHIDKTSGFIVYSSSWENNSFLFKILVWISQQCLSIFGIHPGHGQFVARITVVSLVIAWIVYLLYQRLENNHDLFERGLLIVAAVFLLSPTQFPWYYTWLLPFLVVRVRPSLMLFTVLLPLYYLKYYLGARGSIEIFNRGIIALEHIPVWILLIWEWFKGRRVRLIPRAEVI